ncbi:MULTISPECIES: IclR family transcriptional regulator [unclassified Haladaptatus]|uniref:IclR family transcriptional regulator n=1 Tax=unclassified Haladaptatus TaxID=2622732 RepID=UPI002FCE0A2D
MRSNTSRSSVQAVERTFSLLTALKELDGAGIADLADHTGYANSTIHRHLTTLHDIGYVTKEGTTYNLSLGFLDFGEYARTRKEIHRVAKPKIEELAAETNERCQFVVEEHGYGVYVHVATGQHAVETDSRVGTRLYLHATSVGKAILAHLPAHRVDEIIDQRGLPQITQNTVTDRDALFAELEQIRADGIAWNREGNVDGLLSVGSPIIGPDGDVVGSVSVSGPRYRMDREQFGREVGELLLGAANEIELKLKYQ